MGATWLLLRRDLRRRASAVIALTLLVALAGAFVLTAATGARRPDRALHQFVRGTAMWDGSIEVDYADVAAVLDDVAAQPEVAAASVLMPLPMGSDELGGGLVAGLAPGWLEEVYRPRIMDGRLPDANRVDELLVSEATADRQGLAVGDEVEVGDFFDLGLSQRLTVVGIHRGVLDVALGENYPGALATTAFGRRYGEPIYEAIAGTPLVDEIRPEVIARMGPDVGVPRRVLDAVAYRHPAARPEVVGRSFYVAPLERALAVHVEAFWILTMASGLSALLLLGMAVARFTASGTHDEPTLRAVGLSTRGRSLVRFAPAVVVVAAGTALALVGAVLASPLVPLGTARLVESEPGIWIDPTLLLTGGVAFGAGLALVSAVLLRLDRQPAPRRPRADRSSLRLPLPMAIGNDLAYRSGWGRLALVATGVGLGLVVAVGVYTASVDDLIATPARYGSDYDLVLFPADESAFDEFDFDQPGIVAAAVATGAQVTIGGDLLDAQVIDPVRGSAGGTVLRGRAPRAHDEVALGPRTADRLGLDVGDELTTAGTEAHSMRVVGEALLPLVGKPAHGDVMWLTPDGAARLDVEPQEARLLLDLAEGLSAGQVDAIVGDNFDEAAPVPDDVSNLDGVGQVPVALAAFGAVLAAAVLTLALVGSVRHRRHDLAVLRALGLPRQHIRAAVFTAGALVVVPGVAIALTVGVSLGRAYWSTVAAGVPAVAHPVVPVGVTALVVLMALAVGAGLAFGPAYLATAIEPKDVFERE